MSNTREVDSLFLEVTHKHATELLNHHKAKREDWSLAELEERHDFPRLLFEVSERRRQEKALEFPDGVVNGLVITLLTENGIIYYPRDVGRIFNPSDKKPSDSDPHEEFTRLWPTEEFQHGEALRDCLMLTGYDMRKLEEDRKAFQISGNVPRPDDTPSGVAYSGTQELATDNPYRNIRNLLKPGFNSDDALIREICAFIDDSLIHISQDERLHGRFINGIAAAAMRSGNKSVVSSMLQGIVKVTLPVFLMPGRGIPNFEARSLRLIREKVLTPKDIARILVRQYTKIWLVPEHTDLTPEGKEAQSLLIEDHNKRIRKYPDLLADQADLLSR